MPTDRSKLRIARGTGLTRTPAEFTCQTCGTVIKGGETGFFAEWGEAWHSACTSHSAVLWGDRTTGRMLKTKEPGYA